MASEGVEKRPGLGKTRTRSPGKVISGFEVMVSLARAWAAFVCPTSVPSRASGRRAYSDKPFSVQHVPRKIRPKLSGPNVLTGPPSPFSSPLPRLANGPAQTLFTSLRSPGKQHKHCLELHLRAQR